MTRKIPIIATIIVAAAIATMIGLGIWQLGRLQEKQALLALYADAALSQDPVPFPAAAREAAEAVLYRHSSVDCRSVSGIESSSGRNAREVAGFKHVATCATPDDKTVYVALGWSRDPVSPEWSGGVVTGMIGPGSPAFARLVADPPQAGLEPLAQPDPRDIPNNHLAYAWQWFIFAATALVIYILALRRRWR